ncbi:MAG: 6-carboxytetrahydropterin synthase [Bacteroidales bacterium]|nr:6-carboxytetrahydropterin synthase [Bacteroidales bacterium]
MAHALPLYEGKCHNIHGHSYKLFVTVEGTAALPDMHSSIGATRGGVPVGMVIDFSQIKRIVEESIISRFDHALVLPDMDATDSTRSDSLGGYPANLMRVPFQPTTENLLLHFASLLEGKLPDGTRLYSLKLFETESSCAELVF